MIADALLPGFVAATGEARTRMAGAVPSATMSDAGPATLARWGVDALAPAEDGIALCISRVRRRATGRVAPEVVAAALREDPASLADMLPPFGGVFADARGVRVVGDGMGFQQLFLATGRGGVVASGSELLVARLADARLDETAVGIQSLLGWQLGQRTLHRHVEKLAPGSVTTIDDAGASTVEPGRAEHDPIDLAEAVDRAADLLRTSMGALLDDHPDAVLQLTGGMDSRLLLSAIAPARRRGLRAMTLDVPGAGDVAVARRLAARYGIEHDVRGLSDVSTLSPAEAWRLCRVASTRLDAMSDPVALAAQRVAERAFPQGVRISGLGGEVARGFYYVGRVRDRPYRRADAARLAGWRMFVNEAVEPGLLTADFAAWARERAVDAVFDALRDGGPEWFRATDELYLHHRMQRWAGATDVAVSAERVVINPMLDPQFLRIASRLSPHDKAGARFLGLLQERLDPELAAEPLDGRPAPSAYAHPSPLRPLTDRLETARRFTRKGVQRLRHGSRAPAGGEVMAGRVIEHWRAQPDILAPLAAVPFIDAGWIDALVEGRHTPRVSAVAFLTNLLVATGAD
ncbi:asparagine synthase-related protein [Microbacterium sp. W1N]|uniref:asparagine synthase-related protein n=1 Tax=Microbacterium festucae TaxID=2977531 RepID=UPI0021C040BF|nr:asparagine synthase-related protein [Microbacterium festucae]MCT9818994.1 asparagine synthase-related protein [Microbacterium festucae]